MDRQERRAYNREYRKQNKEKIKSYYQEYRKQNKEKIKSYYQEYCKQNKEKIILYYRLNKSKINEYSRLYRLNYGSQPIPLSIEEQEIKIIKAPITIYFS